MACLGADVSDCAWRSKQGARECRSTARASLLVRLLHRALRVRHGVRCGTTPDETRARAANYFSASAMDSFFLRNSGITLVANSSSPLLVVQREVALVA
jgi:hypothetical protein